LAWLNDEIGDGEFVKQQSADEAEREIFRRFVISVHNILTKDPSHKKKLRLDYLWDRRLINDDDYVSGNVALGCDELMAMAKLHELKTGETSE